MEFELVNPRNPLDPVFNESELKKIKRYFQLGYGLNSVAKQLNLGLSAFVAKIGGDKMLKQIQNDALEEIDAVFLSKYYELAREGNPKIILDYVQRRWDTNDRVSQKMKTLFNKVAFIIYEAISNKVYGLKPEEIDSILDEIGGQLNGLID